MVRRGRFDELFFVDLPDPDERRSILRIHLEKRGKWNSEIDTIALTKKTDGYSGVDLEAVVKNAIEEAFINDVPIITTNDLLNSVKKTKSISVTLKDKIDELRKDIQKYDFMEANCAGKNGG